MVSGHVRLVQRRSLDRGRGRHVVSSPGAGVLTVTGHGASWARASGPRLGLVGQILGHGVAGLDTVIDTRVRWCVEGQRAGHVAWPVLSVLARVTKQARAGQPLPGHCPRRHEVVAGVLMFIVRRH